MLMKYFLWSEGIFHAVISFSYKQQPIRRSLISIHQYMLLEKSITLRSRQAAGSQLPFEIKYGYSQYLSKVHCIPIKETDLKNRPGKIYQAIA